MSCAKFVLVTLINHVTKVTNWQFPTMRNFPAAEMVNKASFKKNTDWIKFYII